MENEPANAVPYTERTLSEHIEPRFYSAQFLADENQDLNVKADTIRIRWFNDWVTKVAPMQLLKNGQGKFTELGRDLINNYAQRVKREGVNPEDWIVEAKSHYSHEWESEGIIEGELMPEEVGGALAQMRQGTSSMEGKIASKLAKLKEFKQQLGTARSNFSEAERKQFQSRGVMRGLERFELETEAELATYNQLRQEFFEGEE
ncbi:MAG: hypothetical protein HC840_13080 [Leptolyngbyaceae cyanobacterium RM2_2_4]|nr:hypothetical protein [Leptolyngbyaceae cyanobacterium RM2_2_4]